MSLMRPGALLLIRVHPSDQERLSPRVCIRKEILSQNSIWKWNDTVHTIRRGERGVQVNMSMSLGQLVLLHSSLSENVNQMVSDHVWPGCYIQKKTLPLFGSAVSRGLITFNFKSILSGIQRKKKKKKLIRNVEAGNLPIFCISDNYRDQMLNTTKSRQSGRG